ncbi:MAG: hypothetical protein OXP07_17400 [Defluviicoccus sp.]|nr:hypothetical protein [Defluviicoccus sp.]
MNHVPQSIFYCFYSTDGASLREELAQFGESTPTVLDVSTGTTEKHSKIGIGRTQIFQTQVHPDLLIIKSLYSRRVQFPPILGGQKLYIKGVIAC